VSFFFIKPTLTDDDEKAPLIGKEKIHIQDTTDAESTSVLERIPLNFKLVAGIILAVASGILYGVNMIPMSLWVQHEKSQGRNPHSLDFVLSHFIGIYLFSTIVFLVYNVAVRPPQIFAQSILPSYISGAMWGVAQCGLMAATQILGYTTGFPIGSTGPLIISSLWSVLYFREIRGNKNFLLLGASFVLLLGGIILLSLSH